MGTFLLLGLVAAFEACARFFPASLPHDLKLHKTFQMTAEFKIADGELGEVLKTPYHREFHWGKFKFSTHHEQFAGGVPGGYRGIRGARLEEAEIVVLGDSLVYGSGMNAEEAWVGRLGTLSGLKTANLGVSGYGSSQMAGLLGRCAASVHPKVVIAFLHADAPVIDYYLRLWKQERDQGGLRPWESRFVNYSNQRQFGLPPFFFRAAKTLWKHSMSFKLALPFILQLSRSAKRRDEALAAGMPILRKNALRLKAGSLAAGAKLVVVLDPAWRRTNREKSAELSDFLKDSGIMLIDLGPVFEPHPPRKLKIAFDPHWNEAGHALVGDEVFRILRGAGLL